MMSADDLNLLWRSRQHPLVMCTETKPILFLWVSVFSTLSNNLKLCARVFSSVYAGSCQCKYIALVYKHALQQCQQWKLPAQQMALHICINLQFFNIIK